MAASLQTVRRREVRPFARRSLDRTRTFRSFTCPMDSPVGPLLELKRIPTRWWRTPEITTCTPQELLEILTEPSGGYFVLPTDPYNEVYPNIYLSDGATALCTSLLKRLGITHVLNAAQGKDRPNQVNTWSGFYTHSGIKFLGVEAFDIITFRLSYYFEEAANFIQEALDSGGKVLVHCRCGISRSATLVLAYLMIKKHMSVQEAVKAVRAHRSIIPNDGFLRQLCELNDKLYKSKVRNGITT